METRYKFLKLKSNKIKSNSGDCTWKLNEWKHEDKIKSNSGDCTWKLNEWKHEDKINLCNSGFHCSKEIWEAFSYVQGEILAEVEVKGESSISDDKEVYSDMRIVKMYKWQKKDSVALSIYSAELCLKNFEKFYPDDKRPREAIEAAKKWVLEPTRENESAARSAKSAARSAESAARSAESAAWSAAESAAWSAAWSAKSAARSAESAARSAESAAWSAAESAESAARSAAWSAESAARKDIFTKICTWFDKRIKQLETYE